MWRDPQPPKPFYRRFWFLSLVALLLLLTAAGVWGWLYLRAEFQVKADSLDMNRLHQMESASIVYDRKGRILGRIYIQNRDTIELDQMSGYLVPALIAAEDNRFFSHPGVDIIGVFRALLTDLKSGRLRQGASTITQQLARNTFPEVLPASDRTVRRKLLEMFVARRIEKVLSKQEILELYLNRVYFGSGFYGVEAAAHGYFGKSARDLTLSECATLTGMLRSPNNLSPWRNRQASIDIRNYVLARMLELGFISNEDYEKALAEDLAVKNRKPIYAQSYAVEFVRQQVANLVGSNEGVYGDGYRIYTTLDADLQHVAENSIRARLEEVENRKEFGRNRQTYAQYDRLYRQRGRNPEGDPIPSPSYLQGALIAIENHTGGVLALVGGRNFAHNQFNRALLANRPMGTAFTPLVFAAAFEKGIFPGSLFQDAVIDNRFVMIGGTTGVLGEWGPERADNEYEGPITAHEALTKSKNAATVRLGLAVGVEAVLELAKKAGIDSQLRPYPATFLGSSETTLEDLTLAFTIFPNGGKRPLRPFVIERVVQKDGKEIYRRPQRPFVDVISPSTAYEVHSALADSLEWGTADKAYTKYGLKKMPLGGKTGTAYNFTDAAFIGYSSSITCGVWVGFDAPQPIYRGAFSSEIALPIWVDFMNASFANYPAEPFHRPDNLRKYEICRRSGLLATPQCVDLIPVANGETIEQRTVIHEWGTEEQAPRETCDVHGEGRARLKTVKESGEAPRPQLAVDTEQFVSVQMRAPTVVGDDPYGALSTSSIPVAIPVDPNVVRDMTLPPAIAPVEPQFQLYDPSNAIPRAVPVKTLDQPEDASLIKLDAPPPLEF